MTQKLKYLNYDIVFQEVPNETALAINITGCPYRCEGCHSSLLQTDVGKVLDDDIYSIIEDYKKYITCVVFMGGDQQKDDLMASLKKVKEVGLKTCLYTGASDLGGLEDFIPYLDYLKTGLYVKNRGGLSSPTTNQRFYTIKNNVLKNMTTLFTKDSSKEAKDCDSRCI